MGAFFWLANRPAADDASMPKAAVVTEGTFACKSIDIFEKIGSAFRANDAALGTRRLLADMKAGDCVELDAGENILAASAPRPDYDFIELPGDDTVYAARADEIDIGGALHGDRQSTQSKAAGP